MASPEKKHDFLDPPDPDGPAGEYLGSLGHYRVVRELGKGGMGYVFLAEDTRLKRQVALKVMNQKIAATPGSRKRFISEARSMAAVHHDNVATIFEVGEYKGTPFMAMELLEGDTLEVFKSKPERPDFQELIGYAKDIARGLSAAHQKGIVHRDIKPANIWLDTKTGRIKILDFGLALAHTPVDQLSGRGAVIGTPGYLSPEQARSEPLDDRSDLYSAGVVLYELATGRLPIKSKTVAEQLISILAHDPPPLRSINENIPQPLADLIARLMNKEPRDRFESAAELEEALEKVAVECESKTEVAQAINQLQMGLDQVVKNKTDEPDLATVVSAMETPNPFAELPDAIPIASPADAASPLASSPLGSSPLAASPAAASPLATGGSGVGNAAPAKKTAKPEPAESNSKMIWIGIAVAVVVLGVSIPALVFWSTSNAIARQQEGVVQVTVQPRNSQPNQTPKSNSNPPSVSSQSKPNPINNVPSNNAPGNNSSSNNEPTSSDIAASSTDSQSASFAPLTRPVSIKIQSKSAFGWGQTPRWLLGDNNRNGSFEKLASGIGELRAREWTIRKSGDAGWVRASKPHPEFGRVHAYVGKGSELILISPPLNHRAVVGETYRVAVDLGGEGPGVTECKLFLGFKADDGQTLRYEIASIQNESQWLSPKKKRPRYQYVADTTVAGRQPFLEVLLSNKASTRQRAFLDRLVVTVDSSTIDQLANQSESGAGEAMANMRPEVSPNAMGSASGTDLAMQDPATGPSIPVEETSARQNIIRSAILSVSDDGGADVTVKKSGSSNSPLGERSILAVQTRNGKEVQHTYLRFSLDPARGGYDGQPQRNGNNKEKGKLKIANAQLSLQLAMAKPPLGATISVYGFNDPLSDKWPENKIVWSNSLSKNGLVALPFLAEVTIEERSRQVTISSPELDEFLSDVEQSTVTFVISGEFGNSPITFASKEDPQRDAPTLRMDVLQ